MLASPTAQKKLIMTCTIGGTLPFKIVSVPDTCHKKMMIQKPDERRDNAPPVPYPPACASCPYKGQSPVNVKPLA